MYYACIILFRLLISLKLLCLPKTSPERTQNWECWDVFRLLECPVVRSEGSSQSHLSQSNHKVHQPEHHEEVEDLGVEDKTEQQKNTLIYIYVYMCFIISNNSYICM